MELILALPFLMCFFIGMIFTPIWIRRAKKAGLQGKDMHKIDKKEVAEAGGVPIITSFLIGCLIYIALLTFYFEDQTKSLRIFALLTTILIISFIGLIDDILGWKIGLNKKTRIFLVLIASIPLVVINAGESTISIPFFGAVNLGLLYPFVIIPLGIIGSSVTYNFLAGYNGLESSQGIIILTALAIITSLIGEEWISVISLCMVFSLLSFYFFNKHPSSIFPGDILTYSIGALIACVAIVGNIERIAIFFFIPYILETFLKLRGGLKKESFGKLNEDGSLEKPYEKYYGLEHIAIDLIKNLKKDKKAYEKEVVFLINLFQILIVFIGFYIFRSSIF